MKKILIVLILILATFLVKAQGAANVDTTIAEIKIDPSLQKKYLPNGFNVFIGITKEELFKKRPGIKQPINSSLDNAKEKVTSFDKIDEITYQLDENKKVYEFIFTFTETTTNKEVMDWAIKKIGAPNDGTEWLVELKDGLKLKMWVFKNKFCIADSRQF